MASNRKEIVLLMKRMEGITGELKVKDILLERATIQVPYDDYDDVYMADNETHKLREERKRGLCTTFRSGDATFA